MWTPGRFVVLVAVHEAAPEELDADALDAEDVVEPEELDAVVDPLIAELLVEVAPPAPVVVAPWPTFADPPHPVATKTSKKYEKHAQRRRR